MTLYWTGHARDRLLERNLIMSDVLHVLKRGFVYEEAEPSTRHGLFKYAMESPTPNSGARTVRVVVVPDVGTVGLKIVTVMWKDEPRN
ncbi:DUF4258 domain-containing protein [Futiania mangrovi]|uniref:DUF4258 domain-containing protein n=1 Tax=Futiania mangrovi TaxID=2959716 RepID=A0A9J6PB02_9PROT|nr:DUF4258 domain-containing protein [Futiania mangrovii]MCP1337292.1 DUF4258 domain-containing protein [Futiania mangrovii]